MIRVKRGTPQYAERIAISTTCPSFSGILCGNSEGKVWVNQLDTPHLSIVYSAPVGAFRILGKVETEQEYDSLIQFIQQDLFQQLREEGETEFEFAADYKELEEKLLASFHKHQIIKDQELSYLQESKELSVYHPIKDYIIRKVDDEFLEKDYVNRDFLMGRLMESWGDKEQYLKYGIAFVALEKDKIVGVILGTSNYNDILPIDIETLEEHREKGIATELTNYFLNYCVKNHKTAYWNCITSNIASQGVAKKAGLVYKGKNDYFYFSFV